MAQEKYSILIGEPWNFESLDGQNVIRGEIIKKSNQFLIFKSNHSLIFDKFEGNILVLTPRHYGIDFSDINNERLSFNGGLLLLKEYDEKLNQEELQYNSKFVIIGSFRKDTQ